MTTTFLRTQPAVDRSLVRTYLTWTAGFVAFPIAGLAGMSAAGGQVDSATAALLGGTVTGAVLGAGQFLASGRRLDLVRWVVSTGLGLGLGLLLGASTVDYATGTSDLALQGALTGAVIGPLQALVLPAGTRLLDRIAWAITAPGLWALGWTVTSAAGVSVEDQFTIFGATGALAFSAASGLLVLSALRTSRRVS